MPLRVWIYANCGEVVLNKLVHVMTIRVNTCRQTLRTRIHKRDTQKCQTTPLVKEKLQQTQLKAKRTFLRRLRSR